MRLLIVTQNEPFYLPVFLNNFIKKCSQNIVGIILLKPFNEKLINTAKRAFILYGLLGFFAQGVRYSFYKLMEILSKIYPIFGPWSVSNLAKRHGIRLLKPQNINSESFINILLEDLKPDLIISIAASQIFKKRILSIPKYGCINIHSAPLPKYRGMLPTFWALYHKEKETAVTVHYMNEKLDDGDIICQRKVQISKEDTLHSLIRKTKKIGVYVLIEAIKKIENGSVKTIPNDRSKATYFSFPTRREVVKFKKVGRRIL